MSIRVNAKEFQKMSEELLTSIGAHVDVAVDCAYALTSASLRGIDTHGIALLPKILRRVRDNRCRVEESLNGQMHDKTSAVGIIDAKLAPGQHSCMVAAREAAKRASQFGSGLITVRNSTHFGCCSPFLEVILRERMVGFVGSNSVRSMATFGLKKANLGNNPFGFAAPRNDKRDFVFDFSSAVMSYGKRIDYLEKGKELPKGSFVTSDDDDKTTSVVYEIADSLEQVALPFGGFKGASVAVIIEILSGLLSGGHSGADTESFDKDGLFLGPSHFVLAIAPQKFGLVKFEENVQRYIEGIRRGEDIRLPGDRAEKEMACRRSLGIPIQDPVVNEIESWATELDVGVTW